MLTGLRTWRSGYSSCVLGSSCWTASWSSPDSKGWSHRAHSSSPCSHTATASSKNSMKPSRMSIEAIIGSVTCGMLARRYGELQQLLLTLSLLLSKAFNAYLLLTVQVHRCLELGLVESGEELSFQCKTKTKQMFYYSFHADLLQLIIKCLLYSSIASIPVKGMLPSDWWVLLYLHTHLLLHFFVM